jgi:CRP-like cAMP-binding protein
VVASHMTARTLAANTPLLTAGDFNDALFFVKHGELLVSLPFERSPLFVGARPAGTWVGEVTLLEPGPATANVIASQDTEVLELSAASLATLTRTHPAVVAHLVRALSEDLARRMRSASVVLEDMPSRPPPGFFKGVLGRLFGGGAP